MRRHNNGARIREHFLHPILTLLPECDVSNAQDLVQQ